MTINGKKLKTALRAADITQEKAADAMGISRQTLSKYLQYEDLSDEIVQNVKTYLHIDLTSKDFNLGEPVAQYAKRANAVKIGQVVKEDNQSPYIDMGNGQFIMVVPLIPLRASAGYREHYQDEAFIDENYDKHYFPVTRQYRGRYFAFVTEGDSMENYSDEALAKESIPDGATVTGREIPKHYWQNKFHLNSFKDYVIVHKDTIVIKRIVEHDTVNGTIICHSLNPDKKRHPDFTIHLDDCLQILNIVNVTLPR